MKKLYVLAIFLFACNSAFSQFTYTLTGDPLSTVGWATSTESYVSDSTFVLTDPLGNQSGYIYYDSAVNLTACSYFTVDFNFKITPPPFGQVADGIAFWYISNPPTGFILGGGIGLPTDPNGLIMILDTYDNDGDGNNPSETLLAYDGTLDYTEGTLTDVLGSVVPNQNFIDDGSWHHCKIVYGSDVVSVYFNHSSVASISAPYTITIPSGYFGFSASTGAAYSTQVIDSVVIVGSAIPPPPGVTALVNYCVGDAAVPLTATGTGVRWFTSDTATVPLSGPPTPNTSVVGTTTYYLDQKTGACGSGRDSIKVVVNAIPAAPAITGDTVYCQDALFIPFTVADTGIRWYTTLTGGASTATAPTVPTDLPGTYTYYATETVLGCESPRDSISVDVHPTPAPPTITGVTTYCQGSSFVPFTVTGTNVLWYTTTTGGTGSTVAPTLSTSAAGVTTFYATQTILGCESPRDSITVTINAVPAPPTVTGPATYCQGQAFVPFTVTGTGVLWYDASGGTGSPTAPVVNTSVPGGYTFFATQTVNGCTSKYATANVTVNPGVTAGFESAIKRGCAGDTVVFTNTSTGETVDFWKFGDGNISSANSPVHVFAPGNYTVKLSVNNGSCFDSTTQTFNLLHPMAASFTLTPDTLCEGHAVTFSNTSIGDTPTYVWNFGDGYTDTSVNPTHTYTNQGVFQVTLIEKDFVPCFDTAHYTVYVDSSGPINIDLSDSILCAGQTITFTGTYTSIGNTGISWDFGDGYTIDNKNPVGHAYQLPGTVTIKLTADYRVCPEMTATKKINIRAYPILNLGADTALCPGNPPIPISDYLNAANVNAHWLWNTGDTTFGIIANKPGIYSTMVTINGCSTADTVWVRNDCYVDIPNAFTPNGDGVNDYFFPRQFLSSNVTTFKMLVYDRWGQEIFSTTNTNGRGWDGSFNNKQQPEGVYVYMIDVGFANGVQEHHQGNVTLLR